MVAGRLLIEPSQLAQARRLGGFVALLLDAHFAFQAFPFPSQPADVLAIAASGTAAGPVAKLDFNSTAEFMS